MIASGIETLLKLEGDYEVKRVASRSGAERDGRNLARALDDGRGWLRTDATGAELANAIGSLIRGEAPETGLGRLGVTTIVILCVTVLVLVLYLVWLAVY